MCSRGEVAFLVVWKTELVAAKELPLCTVPHWIPCYREELLHAVELLRTVHGGAPSVQHTPLDPRPAKQFFCGRPDSSEQLYIL